jgi:hypothetical protein
MVALIVALAAASIVAWDAVGAVASVAAWTGCSVLVVDAA